MVQAITNFVWKGDNNMTGRKVLITFDTMGGLIDSAHKMLKGFEVIEAKTVDNGLNEHELVKLISEVDGYIAGLEKIDSKLLENASKLKVISRFGVGYDNVDIPAAAQKGIVVCNTPGVMTHAVAELTIGLMLSAARQIPYIDKSVKSGKWIKNIGIELFGSTLGIIGYGIIGREVAKIARALGMKVLYYDPFIKDKLIQIDEEYRELPDLLSESDVVSLHIPLTKQTQGMIGKNELDLMKPSAILVNCSRGGVVDETELIRKLKNNELFGAAIDVFENEPYVNKEFFALKNVILTSHIGSYTSRTLNHMAMVAAKNVIDVLMGNAPQFPVKMN